IFQNVFNNAVKFTNEGSIEVKVRPTADKSGVEFEVADTGVGIEESKIDSIFEPFHQVDNSTQRAYSGLGLGLTVAPPARAWSSGSMDNSRYIWCRKCGAIHHVSDFDRFPVYPGADDEDALLADDWRDFMARHAGHRLEPMRATGKDHFPSGSRCDPMAPAYLEVSNGAETLLLRRSRKSIEAPLDYEIVKGELVENGASLEIQEQAIRKEMKLHFR